MNVVGAKENPVEESKPYCHHGCCRYYGRQCAKCCRSLAEAQAANIKEGSEVEATQHARGGHGGGHGGWRSGHGK